MIPKQKLIDAAFWEEDLVCLDCGAAFDITEVACIECGSRDIIQPTTALTVLAKVEVSDETEEQS